MVNIIKIQVIGPTYAERLVQLAIKTTDKLLELVQLIKGVILPRSRKYQKN